MLTVHDEIARCECEEEIEMLGDGFFVASSDEYSSYYVVSNYYFSDTVFFCRNSRNYTTLHPSFGHFDDLDTRDLVEFDEFLYRFDEFGIDRYYLLSSLFSQKCKKCINMLDRRDIDSE